VLPGNKVKARLCSAEP